MQTTTSPYGERSNHSTGVVVTIAIVALLLGGIVGYLLANSAAEARISAAADEAERDIEEIFTGERPTNEATTESTLAPGNPDETAFTIKMSDLSESQRTAIRAAGVSGDEIVITKGMVACVEADLGAQRTMELSGGSSPTISEAVTIVACYRDN